MQAERICSRYPSASTAPTPLLHSPFRLFRTPFQSVRNLTSRVQHSHIVSLSQASATHSPFTALTMPLI